MALRIELSRRTLAFAITATCLVFIHGFFAVVGSTDRLLQSPEPAVEDKKAERFLVRLMHFLWDGHSSYQPVWPEMKFGWEVVVGSMVGFLGAALGSVGGVGGGGIFVPMLTLIIGFDPKSSTAISKCMIMGAAGSTVYYNMRLRHPTLDMPLIDYDLALLFQPMLMLGISIGVAFNVIFADWMEAAQLLESESKPGEGSGGDYKALPSFYDEQHLLERVCTAAVCLAGFPSYTDYKDIHYNMLYLIPIAASVSLYEAIGLYKGTRIVASRGKEIQTWKPHLLFLYCVCGMVAGIVGGLLGLGGGFILGPLFLELGIPPQVASATSTFSMTFSSSMSVVQYYLLKRFPIPYASYFVLVATFAALAGQHVVRRVIAILGRTSIIIFILALTIFVSAISLGGVGIADMIEKLENHDYMGFDNLCYHS
nr:sulfite exporter TauE/SafE family protein 3-like [Ipomoea batatas]